MHRFTYVAFEEVLFFSRYRQRYSRSLVELTVTHGTSISVHADVRIYSPATHARVNPAQFKTKIEIESTKRILSLSLPWNLLPFFEKAFCTFLPSHPFVYFLFCKTERERNERENELLLSCNNIATESLNANSSSLFYPKTLSQFNNLKRTSLRPCAQLITNNL